MTLRDGNHPLVLVEPPRAKRSQRDSLGQPPFCRACAPATRLLRSAEVVPCSTCIEAELVVLEMPLFHRARAPARCALAVLSSPSIRGDGHCTPPAIARLVSEISFCSCTGLMPTRMMASAASSSSRMLAALLVQAPLYRSWRGTR